MRRSAFRRFAARLGVLTLLGALASHHSGPAAAQTSFARTIAELSEPGGYFDTDNLISNERSYLWVLPDLERAAVRGGAYIGVGPDQNFSYIASVQPAVAFIVDIRRDNLLLHLLFKALFAASPTRAAYLGQLLGRSVAPTTQTSRQATMAELLGAMDRAPRLSVAAVDALRARLDAEIGRMGLPLSGEDRGTIDRFHRTFIDEGLDLQFTSTGRAPQSYYPTYRDLLLETDQSGRPGNFLATEGAFQFVKGLQARDLVIPVTGDLSGRHALTAIGRLLTARKQQVSAVYTSNVEFYLARSGALDRFLANLRALPRAGHAVLIRSRFGGGSSSSEIQPISDLVGTRGARRAP
jgi:hypothetical protein